MDINKSIYSLNDELDNYIKSDLSLNDNIEIDGSNIKIIEKLGSLNKITVYLVEYEGKKYALKWCSSEDVPWSSREYIINIIKEGSPSESFLWPKYIIDAKENTDFGYLMELIPYGYYNIVEIFYGYKIVKEKEKNTLKKEEVKFKNLYTCVNAALNIVNTFKDLHRAGMYYHDLTDEAIYIDINNGDVLMDYCENIYPFGERDNHNFYIDYDDYYNKIYEITDNTAPETMRNDIEQNIQTDRYSIAVILFKLLFRGHPLEGAKILRRWADPDNLFKYYDMREDDVFIYDPDDNSNRPLKGLHDNVINLWRIYPDYIKDAFIRAFTEGLKDPSRRVLEIEWERLLSRLRLDIISCGCGYTRYSTGFQKDGKTYKCPKCGKTYMIMNISNINKHETISIPIYPGQKICKVFTENLCSDFETVVAIIAESKKHPGIYGMSNKSDKEIKITLPNGNTGLIKPGNTKAIAEGMIIYFEKGIIARL